jgi:hypothetical protein
LRHASSIRLAWHLLSGWLEEEVFDIAEFALDGLGEVAVVDEDAELDVAVLRAPGEVGAGAEEKAVVDGEELGVIADRAAVEAASPQHRGRTELLGDLGGGGRATASMAALISGRRPGAMTLSAAVSVSPSARWSASSLASVPVSSRPRCLADECAVGSADGAEESNIAAWQVDEEPPVEEAVGPLAGDLRGHHAAMAGRAVQEVLRVPGVRLAQMGSDEQRSPG